jgi:S-adenosylmethionine decarboxylase
VRFKLKALGRHVLAEMYDCDPVILNDHELIENILIDGAKHAKATIVESVFHKFNPHGVSGVVVIADSHLSIHTWPEYGFAALDLFTCGEEISPWVAFEYVAKKLKSKNYTTMEVNRGTLHLPNRELKHKPLKAGV